MQIPLVPSKLLASQSGKLREKNARKPIPPILDSKKNLQTNDPDKAP